MQLFHEQQSMFNFLRNDLKKYKEVFEKAMEHETMYSPLTPTHQFSANELNALPKTQEGIVDLNSVMETYREPLVKRYEEEIELYKKQLKDVRQEEQKANSKADELEEKLEQ